MVTETTAINPDIEINKSKKSKKDYIPYLIIGLLLSFLVILSIVALNSARQISTTSNYHNPILAIKEMERSLRIWDQMAIFYQGLFAFLGLSAITMSIYVASSVGDEKKKRTVKFCSVAAACIFSWLSAFNLGKKSNDIRDAYRYLNKAMMNYESSKDTSETSINNLITAYGEAERMIGPLEFNATSSSKQTHGAN
ncbi:hypothetical protein [Puia dinghuensis]|uniref:Uncharacterized protein n=1 Tax=Puia dinghuensis TaxID=1792502 RepID=A0A8J2XS97_9BACT|nr:hypothetical protein [Puia dinghuensis]GGA90162.1 hypothetical protein GCM10011511_11760 [Puia dinghuensis]